MSDNPNQRGRVRPEPKRHAEVAGLWDELVAAVQEVTEADLGLAEARKLIREPEARRRAAGERLERARRAIDTAAGMPTLGGHPVEARRPGA